MGQLSLQCCTNCSDWVEKPQVSLCVGGPGKIELGWKDQMNILFSPGSTRSMSFFAWGNQRELSGENNQEFWLHIGDFSFGSWVTWLCIQDHQNCHYPKGQRSFTWTERRLKSDRNFYRKQRHKGNTHRPVNCECFGAVHSWSPKNPAEKQPKISKDTVI